jgi:hypothetical protein
MKFFGSKNNDKDTEHILRGNTYVVQHLKYYEALRRHLYAESSVAEAAGSMKSVKNMFKDKNVSSGRSICSQRQLGVIL